MWSERIVGPVWGERDESREAFVSSPSRIEG